jgi:hypothetical protein
MSGGTGHPRNHLRARAAARAAITTPLAHPSCPTRGRHRSLSSTSSGETRPATGHDIAMKFFDEPMSARKVRQDTERMPNPVVMTNRQVSLRELSELSRI